MMRGVAILSIIIITCFSCDSSTEEAGIHLAATVTGRITTLDEHGRPLDDRNGVTITLRDGEKFFRGTSDEEGNYTVHARSGTYTIDLSQNGYPDQSIEAFQVAGGDAPFYRSFTMARKSTTRFSNLEMNIDGSTYITANMFHNYVPDPDYRVTVPLKGVLFVSTSPDVSETNYQTYTTFSFNTFVPIDEVVEPVLPVGFGEFGSGTKLYGRLYGIAPSDAGIRPPDSDKVVFSTICESPSNVAEFIVP